MYYKLKEDFHRKGDIGVIGERIRREPQGFMKYADGGGKNDRRGAEN
jgi:hypothetical protein